MNISYLKTITSVFAQHYKTGKDIWSEDLGLRLSTILLGNALKGRAQILDIGCGRGSDAEALLSQGHSVHGLDLVENKNWEALRSRWPERARFSVTDFQSFNTSDQYDAILDNGCFHHQPPEQFSAYLNKVHDLLKLEGCFCLNTYSPKDPAKSGITMTMADNRFATAFTPAQLNKILVSAGLRPCEFKQTVSSTHGGRYLIVVCKKD
jgi:cyclopropane fatty-acyl-phospholipid synthase-like methyltransferase